MIDPDRRACLIAYVGRPVPCEAGSGDAERGFGVLAQLEQEVAALHAVLERLLHQAGEVGVAGLGQAGLGVGDRGVQGGRGVAAGIGAAVA